MLGLQKRVGILKLGCTWPLPEKLLKKYLRLTDKIMVVEEVLPFLEENIKVAAMGMLKDIGIKTFYGKMDKTLPSVGELNPDIVATALGKIMKVKPKSLPAGYIREIQKVSAIDTAAGTDFLSRLSAPRVILEYQHGAETRRPRRHCLRRYRLLRDGIAFAGNRFSYCAHASFHGFGHGTRERFCQTGSLRSG